MIKALSVVVPVYNVEQYIRKCLNSLLVPAEILELLDIVVVNDGTPDQSAEIAREYERLYPNVFRIIDKENGGHGSAWNRGIQEAKGKYLFFLDSDDWFDTSEFSKLIPSLRECDADLVFVNWTKYYAAQDKEEIIKIKNIDPDKTYDSDCFDWMKSGNGPHLTYAASTVYKTDILKNHMPVFCERVMYDDIILQVLPVICSKSFIYKDLNIYHYLIGRPGQSFDPKVRAKRVDDVSTVLKQVLCFLKDNKDSIPLSSARRSWADFHYSAFATHHYEELSHFSFEESKSRLADWDEFVKSDLPDILVTNQVRLYRHTPFVFYYCYVKTHSFIRKVLKHLGVINKNKLGR